jgi:O-antigen ligase
MNATHTTAVPWWSRPGRFLELILSAGIGALLAGALVYNLKAVLGLGLFFAAIPLIWRSPEIGLLLTVGSMQLEYLGLFTDPRSLVTLSVPKLFGVLTLISWAARRVVRRGPRILVPPELAILAALTVLSVLSLAWAADVTEGIYLITRLASLLLLYLLMANIVSSREVLGRLIMVLVVSTFVLAGVGFLQLAFKSAALRVTPEDVAQSGLTAELDLTEQEDIGELLRVSATTGSSDVQALLLTVMLPLFLYQLEFRSPGWRRPLMAAMLLASLLSLALTYSRMGSIAFIFGLILLIVGGVIRITPFRLALVAGVAVVSLLVLPSAYFVRVFSPAHYAKSEAISLRTDLIRDSLVVIQRHWIAGVGINNLKDVLAIENPFLADIQTPPHNMYLTMLGELGIAGLLLYLAFFWQSLRGLQAARRRFLATGDSEMGALAVTVQVSIVLLLLCNLALESFSLKVWWSVMALGPVLQKIAAMPRDHLVQEPATDQRRLWQPFM